MDYATVIAAVVAYFVAYAVLALGEALRAYLSDNNEKAGPGGGPPPIGSARGAGPGLAPGPR